MKKQTSVSAKALASTNPKSASPQQYEQNQFIIDESRDETNCGMPSGQVMRVGRIADDPDFFKRAAESARKLKALYLES